MNIDFFFLFFFLSISRVWIQLHCNGLYIASHCFGRRVQVATLAHGMIENGYRRREQFLFIIGSYHQRCCTLTPCRRQTS